MKSSKRIWLIGGTQESAEIAHALIQHQIPALVTVTTESARQLYPQSSSLDIWVGRLADDEMPQFIQNQGISAIVDASHPYAVAISKSAIATAQALSIPYLRYERPAIAADHPSHPTFPSIEDLTASDILSNQRVLLTIGYRWLPLFQPWHDRATLFVRILPSTVALNAALAAGFTSDHIIALRPPVTPALEQALWQQWQISMVVTKASGTAGGEDTKRQVAAQLGILLVTIERPAITYPNQTNDIEQAIQFCINHL
ncbi:MAG: cobalt-precorrin-6A reductase [Thainema sp.]